MADQEFEDCIRELLKRVGDGRITMEVEVDQVYAHYQHEGMDFNHPRGGQAKYLEEPLYARAEEFVRRIEERVLDEGAVPPMIDNAKVLAADVARLAPLDLNNLRRSAHPMVYDQEGMVWEKGPEQRRLSEDELRELRRQHPGR